MSSSVENSSPKPGSAALKNMQLLHRESRIFKVPKPPQQLKTRKKEVVLDEDGYVQNIAKIIQRDFFPDLEKLKAQNEYLEASENRDYHRLREITLKYSGERPPTDPGASPATFDTPRSLQGATPTNSEIIFKIRNSNPEKADSHDITSKHTLDSFLATHTSEDNASFDRIAEMEDLKRYLKHEVQFKAEESSKALVESALQLPSIERQADQMELPMELDTWQFKAHNYIMYVPDAGTNDNLKKPELIYHNTRLQTNPFNNRKDKEVITQIAKEQERSLNGKIAMDGSSLAAAPSERGFVATPSPRPGVDDSPLEMTWGEIEGTPFRLDGGDTPLPAVGAGAAYRMLEGGAREQLAHKLAEATRRKRTPAPSPRPNTGLFTPRLSTSDRLASMTPAARRLATKHLISPLIKSPLITKNKSATPRRKTPLVATPKSKAKMTPKSVQDNAANNNLTDNLLQINLEKRTRSKAADFFR